MAFYQNLTMNIKSFFKNNWIHFVVLGVFLIVTVAYFSPEFDGYNIKQHDVEQHKGMSNEIAHHRELTGEEALWTNSMFGGMPGIQISTLYNGNIFQAALISFFVFIGVPSGIFILHLIGFYILALCLRLKPLIGMFGAFAYGFATYEIVILQAGHNSKAVAMALMAPVIGAFIMAYRRNWKWGVILSAFFMTWQLAANHLQVTYYMGILLFAIGLFELVRAIREKTIKKFGITSVAIIGGYLLALLINYGNITLTNDYAKYSIRGENDLTINPDGSKIVAPTDGLDRDYITNWSYGKGESFTLISPYVKGSHSAGLANTQFLEMAQNMDMPGDELKATLEVPVAVYWGDQPMTSGPVYLGIISVFLALLALFFVKDRMKWVIFGVSVLALMLSWGKNFMGLTDFFIDYVPGYSKFRTVTIILVLIELCAPLLAVYSLQMLYTEREKIKEQRKKFLYVSGGFLTFLLILLMSGLNDNYTSIQDNISIENAIARNEEGMMDQIQRMDPAVLKEQYGLNVNNPQELELFVSNQMTQVIDNYDKGYLGLKKVRAKIYKSSVLRSLGIGFLGVALAALFFFTSVSSIVVTGGFIVLLLLDLVPVDRNYLGTETLPNGDYVHWVPEEEAQYPFAAMSADEAILQNEIKLNPGLEAKIKEGERKGKDKADRKGISGSVRRRVIDSYRFSVLNRNTNYRVFDYNGGWGSSRAAFFHKSLGGYHGAKLRNIQNLFEFHIARTNNQVLDMLNVKYFIQGENLRPNPNAMGNAWLVKEVKVLQNPDDEILALGSKFKLLNQGSGKILVNGEEKSEVIVFGGEKLDYLRAPGDTLPIPLSNGLSKGMKAIFVSDVNGKTDLVPEITLEMDTAKSFTSFVSIELLDRFEPRIQALILKDFSSKLSAITYSGEGTVSMTSYAPNKITYKADLRGKQLIVFSEIYYPEGWTAKVDNKEIDILKVNYLLRGLEVDGGQHKIEFVFDLPKLKNSNMLAVAGSVLLFIIIGLGLWKIPVINGKQKG